MFVTEARCECRGARWTVSKLPARDHVASRLHIFGRRNLPVLPAIALCFSTMYIYITVAEFNSVVEVKRCRRGISGILEFNVTLDTV